MPICITAPFRELTNWSVVLVPPPEASPAVAARLDPTMTLLPPPAPPPAVVPPALDPAAGVVPAPPDDPDSVAGAMTGSAVRRVSNTVFSWRNVQFPLLEP